MRDGVTHTWGITGVSATEHPQGRVEEIDAQAARWRSVRVITT